MRSRHWTQSLTSNGFLWLQNARGCRTPAVFCLKMNDFKDFNSTEMMAHIRNKLGGGDGRRKIKGKTAYLWYLPWQRKSQDDLQTPDMGEETPF